MNEILPGLFHFSQVHENIGIEVNSYYLSAERVLIDPMTPAQGLDWFADREQGPPADILLSCRHHYRHAADYVNQFGTTVHCVREGMHEFEGKDLPPVEPFAFGDQLPGGAIAHEVDAISPDETAFLLPAHAALVVADGAIALDPDGPLMFVPDQLMDDPPATKRGLIESFAKLLELDFEHLLLAHGGPRIGTGKQKLREFVEANT